ncbi:NAD(P)H-dependent oxidoreductase [Salinicola rhizosphaerae]|uniref:Flavodoxin-like fold domain-containing protein n=1 Tax=Salinicola rhizosphaerae TaxID=1443141 RepID=A0ABQ3DT15_9GAMM|nr:NAD(P)H-dependent oxidoreductase [Salinicola rhizosphaerae]GHB15036.1 hypothetical protein GCM10009038_11960 [Salinicola rhizosphaerae]
MNVLIVHCHPEPESFNAALTSSAHEALIRNGHDVKVSDLYAEGFEPLEGPERYATRREPGYFQALDEQRWHHERDDLAADVRREIDRLTWANLVILQFPLWWHGAPAMLKGWFDRVLVYGGLYTGNRRFDRGPLRGRRAICSVTTGAPEITFGPFGRSGDIATLMWPTHCSLYYVGLSVLAPHLTYGVQGGGLSYRQEADFREHLEAEKRRWGQRVLTLEEASPLPMSGWSDWNDQGVLNGAHPLRWRI